MKTFETNFPHLLKPELIKYKDLIIKIPLSLLASLVITAILLIFLIIPILITLNVTNL